MDAYWSAVNAERRRELYGKINDAIMFVLITALIVGSLVVLVVNVIRRIT